MKHPILIEKGEIYRIIFTWGILIWLVGIVVGMIAGYSLCYRANSKPAIEKMQKLQREFRDITPQQIQKGGKR